VEWEWEWEALEEGLGTGLEFNSFVEGIQM
jgi:hypothetical protein